jgi:hypothetical protein
MKKMLEGLRFWQKPEEEEPEEKPEPTWFQNYINSPFK